MGYLANTRERAAVLAVHFEQGRDGPRALRYRHQAAESALQRSAFREAVEHLTRALHLLDTVPDADERLQLELDLQVKLGPTLHTLHGPAAPEAEAVYLRVRELAERHHDPIRLYLAVRGLWSINYGRGRYADARENGEQLLALAELGRHTGGLVEAHRALWATLLAMGNPGAALVHIEHGQRLYDPERHGPQAALFGGYDAGTCAWDNLASARWVLGYPDAALTALREGTALARRVDYPPTTIIHLCYAAWIHYYRGDLDARQYAHEAIALGRTHGFSSLGDDGEVVLACVAPTDGGDHRSIPELYAWLCSERARRLAMSRVICLCGLARAAADAGNLDLSFEILAAIPEELRGAFFAPEIERIRGDLLLRRGKRDEAERCFRSGIEIARRRAERSLELRASTSLARLLAHTKRRGEARRVLGGIYGWFTEGFDTADLRAARVLLDQLGTKP
jgi:tetratricopeptide (TPR) repeat protein